MVQLVAERNLVELEEFRDRGEIGSSEFIFWDNYCRNDDVLLIDIERQVTLLFWDSTFDSKLVFYCKNVLELSIG